MGGEDDLRRVVVGHLRAERDWKLARAEAILGLLRRNPSMKAAEMWAEVEVATVGLARARDEAKGEWLVQWLLRGGGTGEGDGDDDG